MDSFKRQLAFANKEKLKTQPTAQFPHLKRIKSAVEQSTKQKIYTHRKFKKLPRIERSRKLRPNLLINKPSGQLHNLEIKFPVKRTLSSMIKWTMSRPGKSIQIWFPPRPSNQKVLISSKHGITFPRILSAQKSFPKREP